MSATPDIMDQPARILIVDDEPNNRQLLKVMLMPEGFVLMTAASGEEALVIVGQEPPDLILLDVMMPGLDGYQVATKIKGNSLTKNIPIVMVTALDDRNARMLGLNAGAEDFISKPVDRAELCVRVRNLLRLKTYGAYYDKYSHLLEGEVVSRTADLAERTRQAAVLAEQAALLDLAQDAIVVRDMHNRVLFWNRGAEVMYGWLSKEAVGRNVYELLRMEFSRPTEEIEADLLRYWQWGGESIHYKRCGARLIVASRWALQCNDDGAPVRILAIDSDITERKAMEDSLFVEKERAQVTLKCIGDAVICTDISGNVTFLNVVAEEMTGWSLQEAVGRPIAEVFRVLDVTSREVPPNAVDMAVRQNRTEHLPPNCVLIRRDGFESPIEGSVAPIHNRQGQATGAVIVFHDVSAAQARVLQMSYAAQHDFLTNLPNRMLMHDRITQATALAARHAIHLAVLFLDLDGFKRINDSLGHTIGDRLLQSVATRLTACVRNSDTVSRQGGDEFVILLSEVRHPQDGAVSATKILAALAEPHTIDGHELYTSASIGLATYPSDGEDAETLLKHADTAMYYAKEEGRNQYHFFSKAMNVQAVERQSLEGSLRGAITRGEFLLHFQPKIDLKTGAITGSEALIRWLHPARGLVPPLQFIPIAEECGLMIPIGQWVLREACRQARSWQDAGLSAIPVAVNVSGVEFRNKDFLEGIRRIINETGLDPCFLELELTESILMEHAESSGSKLKELKSMGMRLAIDDFGTGYSSLSYLKKFPIDTLKVDQSFVRDVTVDAGDKAIVCAVISMAKSFGHLVIAEGVETADQLALLQAWDCNEGQGYYFGRPMEAPQFARLLQSRAIVLSNVIE